MGYELYREVRDGAPTDWTLAERLVALLIADNANDQTRRSWIPVAGRQRKGRWVDGLTEQSGLTRAGVSKALQRLSARGFEFRIPISQGKDGRPVFAVRGHSLDFLVPPIPPRTCPQRADHRPGSHSSDQHPPFEPWADRRPGYDEERADHRPIKGGPPFAPSPQLLPPAKPLPSSSGDVDQSTTSTTSETDLIEIVIEEVRRATGHLIGPKWAARTLDNLKDRNLANPGAYIRAVIRKEPDPQTRFLSLYDDQDRR